MDYRTLEITVVRVSIKSTKSTKRPLPALKMFVGVLLLIYQKDGILGQSVAQALLI